MLTLAIDVGMDVYKILLFYFKSERMCFKVCLTTSYYFSVILKFMETIVFLAFGTMCIASKSGMTSLPTTLTLRNARVHVGSSNNSNMMTYIETFINKIFHFHTILRTPNVNLYNSYVRFRKCLDNM